MANDDPTNQRMGFGFVQARAAGAPYVQPRPGWRMNWEVKCSQCARRLRDLVEQDPSVGELVREIIDTRKHQQMDAASAVEMYHLVLCNRPGLAPSDYWDYALKTYGWSGPQNSN